MQFLLRLLRRYQHVLLFVLLETLALILHFGYSYRQKAQAGLLFRDVEARIERHLAEFRAYFSLRDENYRLQAENLALRNALSRAEYRLDNSRPALDTALSAFSQIRGIEDSLYDVRFEYISARVINGSVGGTHNFFTLDRGSAMGVRPQQGVLWHGSVAGIVVAVNERYSSAVSLLNVDFKLSAMLKASGYVGTLTWDGVSLRRALLREIPHHVAVEPGDSVVTSGFSNIFPRHIPVGVVEEVLERGGDFCTLVVRLATDFRRMHMVSVIHDLRRSQIDSVSQEDRGDAE